MPTAVSVHCNHCGAPLTVDDASRFVTRAHRGSKLAVLQQLSIESNHPRHQPGPAPTG